MKHSWRVLSLVLLTSSLGACVVYEPVPLAAPSPAQRFDRSWSAAAGAMADQGVAVTQQDRGSGTIRGSRGAVLVSANVQTLADGRIQVRFDATGPAGVDTSLAHQLSESYDRRMGR